MGHSLDVRVLDRAGEPVKRAEVEIRIEGIWKGGTLSAFTDAEGHAAFETAHDYEDYRKLWISVRGQRFGPYRIGEGAYTVRLS